MTTAIKGKSNVNLGTVTTSIYTVPASTTTIVRGLTIANILANEITVTVEFTDASGGVTSRVVKDAPIPAGGAIVPFSMENQQNMETGDILKITASQNNAADSTLSYVEIT